ncbi:alpha-galactosidase [Acetatifactor muris]|jgi:alpha-galactosidase|uniref:Melibiase n=1 Tax=Acetatifactor muris TaxID=879566 RepID=A0A2K4ZDY5_9FIRM|nr:alpha-galactosidase [Acetatifactor muris]MCI8801653.1 alpha-galactosidase [Lachnospiraceae bacterium]MCR2047057.1 alpha-galactosidase [Acetatifactor muris]SOY28662.1 Melibiase [Acetatifactor muris]
MRQPKLTRKEEPLTENKEYLMSKDTIFQADPAVRLSNQSLCGKALYRIEKKTDKNRMQVSILNCSDRDLKIKEVVLYGGTLPVSKDTPFYGEGFHMLSQYRGTLEHPVTVGAYGDDETFFRFPGEPYRQGMTRVSNLMLLMPEDGFKQLIAFTSCRRFHGLFYFRENELEIVQDTEDKVLRPGERWELEELAVYSGTDREGLFDALSRDIERNHPRKLWEEIMTGWCSYYALRPMTAGGLYENARAMKERIPELKRLQIDGGYEKHNGDWLEANPELGADMEEICRIIRQIGVEPVGYLSPFIVDEDSDLYHEHPDWLLHDENGKPDNHTGHVKRWYYLDVTHPEALSYLKHVVAVMHDKWGMRYFKLDFLAYGALPGYCRYQNEVTSVEAFRRGMEAIVGLVEKDSFILGCNAPFWPQLGLVHANRASNDIYRSWKVVKGNGEEEFLRNWQHDRLWINDPDCVLLEPLDFHYQVKGEQVIKKSTLTPDEFLFHRAVIVASGGMVLSGDLLYEISEESIRVLKKLMETAGEAAVFEDDSLTVGRIAGKGLVCLFNWQEQEKCIDFRVEGRAEVHDFWSGENLGEFDGVVTRRLRAHSAEVLKVTAAEK